MGERSEGVGLGKNIKNLFWHAKFEILVALQITVLSRHSERRSWSRGEKSAAGMVPKTSWRLGVGLRAAILDEVTEGAGRTETRRGPAMGPRGPPRGG